MPQVRLVLVEGEKLEKKSKKLKEDAEGMDLVEWFLAIDACLA